MKNDYDTLILSTLAHTWILDLDGTIVKHNGHISEGKDTILPGCFDLLGQIPKKDMIIFITSRSLQYKAVTEQFLDENKIRYDYIIYGAPFGERILINDKKESGMETAKSINLQRDAGIFINVVFDPQI